jgi:uncharacterized membrane protein
LARNLAFAVLTVAYPLALWLLRGTVAPRWLALGLLGVGALRLASGGASLRATLALAGGTFALAGLALVLDVSWPLRWYPVLVNGSLLALFAATLVRPPSMAERLARLREPNLPQSAVRYTRKVTLAWCVFFAANGMIAAGTALWGTDAQWALYNGGVAYVLMGLFALAELLIRARVKRRDAEAAA